MEIIKQANALVADLASGQGSASIIDARSMICQLTDELAMQAVINTDLNAKLVAAPAINLVKELQSALVAALGYIDAIPTEAANAFPVMPGFSLDWTDNLLEQANTHLK